MCASKWEPGFIADFVARAGRACTIPDFEPLDVQTHAAEHLAPNGRVVATLPTGTGKTLLAALPFATGLLSPCQMIFMTPLRSLTGAQAHALREQIHGPMATEYLGTPWSVREQYGGTPGDPLYECPTVVCTFDQALSSAAAISYSTSQRRRNINAGAVLGAYLVADEIHLYPRNEALLTLLWVLKNRPELPFLLMTATLSRPLAEKLAHLVDAQLLPQLPAGDIGRLQLQDRVRTVQWRPEPLTPEMITGELNAGKKVLVVVNTVARVIELAQQVEGARAGRGQMSVLHSRFYKADRERIEKRLQVGFGRNADDQSLKVVLATQVVEAGLDISADVLFTELAPANALVQRWGRVARWGGEGQVVVLPPPGEWVLPYDADADARQLVERTRQWLQEHVLNPIPMDSGTEQELLDYAHVAADEQWLSRLEGDLTRRGQRLGQVISEGTYMAAGELIRDVDNRTLLVHGRPEDITEPTRYEGFSVSHRALYRVLGKAEAGSRDQLDEDDDWLSLDPPVEPEWRLKIPVWDPNERGERIADTVAGWEVANKQTLGTSPLLVVHPSFVSYDPFSGLSFGTDKPTEEEYWSTLRDTSAIGRQSRSASRRETFEQHVRRTLEVYERHEALKPRLTRVAERMERWCGWPPGMLDRLIEAAIITHDVGKLAGGWQDFIKEYQRAHAAPVQQWLVHSDQPDAEKLRWSPGPHALSGAAYGIAVGEALDREVDRWRTTNGVPTNPRVLPSKVLFTAVATHHSPSLKDLALDERQVLDTDATREVERVLSLHGLTVDLLPVPVGSPMDYNLVGFGNLHKRGRGARMEWYALALVTRAVRLSDGWSQEHT